MSDEHPTLPVKRVSGTTVDERLTRDVRERLLPARYLRRDDDGDVIETPASMFRRVAEDVAAVEAEHDSDPDDWADRFDERMARLEFVPNSPTLMNAGTDRRQLSACFVFSPDDSLDSIFATLGHAAAVFQTGGGVGYSFSRLRPRGDPVGQAGGVASGPVSFMHVYDEMCAQIRQGGRRRGAQMGVLRVDHPDVGRFCLAKRQEGALANFNVSVAITDEFLAALEAAERYPLLNPQTGEQHRTSEATARFYDTAFADAPRHEVEANVWRDYAADLPGLEPYRGTTDLQIGEPATLPAGFVWTLLVDGAWRNGEPGLFAVDTANREHSFDVASHPGHRIEATNPCAEQPLEEHEACTLGHVNLSLVVADDRVPWFAFEADPDEDLPAVVEAFLDQAIQWERLGEIVHDGVRFLDDVTSRSVFPLAEIDRKVTQLRKIGLGIMGLAELLVQLGVRYGSPASIEVARQVIAFVDHESKQASHELAAERGVFPDWADSKYAAPTDYPDWFERHTGLDPDEWAEGFRLRNHSTTTIAPTGTTAIIANTSGGCEPLFNVVYFRNVGSDVRQGRPLVDFDDYFLETLAANGIDPRAIQAEALGQLERGTFLGPESLSIPRPIADAFVTAGQVHPKQHVRMQAALQEHVDAGISKTINLPATATREDVSKAFHLALELGCKGITVYRNQSRNLQVLTTRPGELAGPGGSPPEVRCCPI